MIPDTSFTSPSPLDLILLFVFAIGIVLGAVQLRRTWGGFSWWARLLLLGAALIFGYGMQIMIPMRGLPGIPGLILFPLLPDSMTNDYYMYFRGMGMTMEEAHALGKQWGYTHGVIVWFVVIAMIFFWRWLSPSKNSFIYGDEPESTA